jgi:hypothetical protein
MRNDENWMKNYARYSTIAFQMIIIVLGGVFLGFKIDEWLHLDKHIFLVIFSLLSGFLALFLAFRDLFKLK